MPLEKPVVFKVRLPTVGVESLILRDAMPSTRFRIQSIRLFLRRSNDEQIREKFGRYGGKLAVLQVSELIHLPADEFPPVRRTVGQAPFLIRLKCGEEDYGRPLPVCSAYSSDGTGSLRSWSN